MNSNHQVSERNFRSESDRKKKTEKADLENKKGIFFVIGIIISLSLALLAFEWKSYDTFKAFVSSETGKSEIIEIAPIVKVTPPEPKKIIPTSLFKPVDNKTEGLKDIFVNTGSETNDTNEAYIPLTLKTEIEVPEENTFILVEEMPEYVGGEEARLNFLRKNVVYPRAAREVGIQGTVHLTFVIEKNGEITDVKILRGIGGGCDEEAIRIIKAMPKWKPGKQRDKAVRVQFNLPIKFKLAN